MSASPPPTDVPATAIPAAAMSGPSEPGGLRIFTESRSGPVTLLVLGDADIATADQLRQALLEAVAGHPEAVIVDVAGLEFCDLFGLDALHAGLNAAQTAGVVMTLRGMSGQLRWLHRTFPRQRPPSPRAQRTARAGAEPGLDTGSDHAGKIGSGISPPAPDRAA